MSAVARVSGALGDGHAVELHTRDHSLAAGDGGVAPYELVLGGLAACTAITLRMYAERKGWPLAGVDVSAELVRSDDGAERVARVVSLAGELSPEQVSRLLDIAERTPVTKTLKQGVTIDTRLA